MDKKIDVSVITPFHNVDMKMFEACKESMLNQEIGFENIEWIIVLHNCTSEYYPCLKEMFKGYDNVILKELNNDKHTPSSPRNFGVQFATGKYIGFLDGDDRYTLHCLSEVTRHLDETDADVACFRREYELEREDLFALTETVLWNQLNERIIVEHGHWDNEVMFNGIFGMITSKIFRREFLVDKEISFDEEIPYAEDIAYTTEVLANAKKVCYLPQLIGYHYYINAGSLVQSSAKSGQTLVGYAKGFVKIFEAFRKYGIDSDAVHGLCMQLAFFILGADPISAEERIEIRDVLKSYLYDLKPLTPNKTRDEDTCRMFYNVPREVILNPENPYDNPYVKSMQSGALSLMKILSDNRDTDYGKMYSFDTIKTIDAYRFRVPLCDIYSIKPLIKLQTNIGEKNIMTSSLVTDYFITDSGELLPNTDEHFSQYLKALGETLSNKKSLFLTSWKDDKFVSNDGVLAGRFEQILVMKFLTAYLDRHKFLNVNLTSNRGKYFAYKGDDLYRMFLVDALIDRDIEQIVAINTVHIAKAFEYLDNNTDGILEEISRTDKERAAELEKIFKEGFGEDTLKKIWPSLDRTIGYGSGELKKYTDVMKKYTGSLPHNHGYYYTELALLGKAVEDESDLFVGLNNNNFYELMSLRKGENKDEVIALSEAEENGLYQLIITNAAGIYRCVSDHIIYCRKTDFSGVYFTIY